MAELINLRNGFDNSGRYTPTLTGVANTTAYVASSALWSRVGNMVSVAMRVQLTATSASTTTQLGISLPVTSNLTDSFDLAGSGVNAAQIVAGTVVGDTTNDRAEFNLVPSVTDNRAYWLSFMYEVK